MLPIAGQTAGPNGLKWVAEGYLRLKKNSKIFFFKFFSSNFFFHGQRRALQLVYRIQQDIRIYMSPIAGQTAGLIGLKFFRDTHWLF